MVYLLTNNYEKPGEYKNTDYHLVALTLPMETITNTGRRSDVR